jgi:hypothetical protein
MLEKQFGEPGRLSALSDEYVAFPVGMLGEVRAWMKKSGHVIKVMQAADEADRGTRV